MLTENDIIEACCKFIEVHGYKVRQQLTTSERGHDIVAQRAGVEPVELRVEAKGETSSKESTNRYGKPFSSAQIRDHVACAIYAAAAMFDKPTTCPVVRVAIALPGTNGHRARVQAVSWAMQRLEIGVFWVGPDRSVELAAPWQL